jgi:transcriptional regulator with XRE-family HTH domain
MTRLSSDSPNHKIDTHQLQKQISRLMRGCRKILGLSQKTVAAELGLDQSGLSRVESGLQDLTAPQWFVFCQLVGISPDSLRLGYIEMPAQIRFKLSDRKGIRLPERFSHHAHSKIRSAVPIASYCEEVLGSPEFNRYMESVGVDSDLLIDLNGPININFIMDTARHLIETRKLRPSAISQLSKAVRSEAIHGSLSYEYNRVAGDRQKLLTALISNMDQYDSDFVYKVEDLKNEHMDISVKPTANLLNFNYRHDSVLGDFLCQYNKGFFSNFSSYGRNQPAKVSILQNQYKGAESCLYRVQTKS